METILRDGLKAEDLEKINKTYEDGEQFTVVHPLVIPPVVMLPTEQHLGTPAKPVVDVDDYVLKGQLIAKATGLISANIHASTSGTVVAIAQRSINFDEAKRGTCIVIESDGKDKAVEYEPCHDYQQVSSKDLINKIREAGIVDMDGEGLPIHVSLKPKKKINTIIISACHWNNAINADDVRLHNYAREIVIGLKIIRQILDQPQRSVIAIEHGKEQVMNAIFTAIENEKLINCEVKMLEETVAGPDRQQLIETITDKKLGSDGLAKSIGAICVNVSTVFSIYRAVCLGEPAITQLITANGNGFDRRQTLAVPLGTPMSFILKEQKFKEGSGYTIRINNFQTGSLLSHQEAPLNKLVSGLWSVGTYPQLELDENKDTEDQDSQFLGDMSIAESNKAQNEKLMDEIVSQAEIPPSSDENYSNNKVVDNPEIKEINPNMTQLASISALQISPDIKTNDDALELTNEASVDEAIADLSAEVEKLAESTKDLISEQKAAEELETNTKSLTDESSIKITTPESELDDLELSAEYKGESVTPEPSSMQRIAEETKDLDEKIEEKSLEVNITDLEDVLNQEQNEDNEKKRLSRPKTTNPGDLTIRTHNILRLQEKLKDTEDKLDKIDPTDEESVEAIMLSINVLIEKIQSAKALREKEDKIKASKDANNLTLLKYMGSLQERLDLAQSALTNSDRASESTQSAVKGALSQLEAKLKNAFKSINFD